MRSLRSVSLLVLFIIVSAALGFQAAQQTDPFKKFAPPGPAINEIIQEFPTNDAMKTAWKIHWSTTRGYGLYIQSAWFKRFKADRWVQIVGDVRLAEMFVPYHSGSPRFWDISYNFDLVPVGKEEAGAFGKVLGSPPRVVAELRDRGLMWIDTGKGGRRGQTFILWACLDAANYRYIIEYGFQDDGVMTCRVGSTGHNYSSREFEGHMHNGLWRVDVNLDGPADNSVYVMEHFEPDGQSADQQAKARTISRPFNNGEEGFEDWKAERFTMLSVVNNKVKNARGKAVAYDVVTSRMGNARHYGPDDESCTQHDFWVTRQRKGETYYKNVPKYVKKKESILDTDVVVWLSNACHHDPRSEDGAMYGTSFTGATPVAWSGFELRPRNFFDGTPHYPYPNLPPVKKIEPVKIGVPPKKAAE